MNLRIHHVLRIVNTLLQDVAEDKSRLEKATKLAKEQLTAELATATPEEVASTLSFDHCIRMAQAIVDVQGFPPYGPETEIIGDSLTMDVADAAKNRIITDFVLNWKEHLVRRKV